MNPRWEMYKEHIALQPMLVALLPACCQHNMQAACHKVVCLHVCMQTHVHNQHIWRTLWYETNALLPVLSIVTMVGAVLSHRESPQTLCPSLQHLLSVNHGWLSIFNHSLHMHPSAAKLAQLPRV